MLEQIRRVIRRDQSFNRCRGNSLKVPRYSKGKQPLIPAAPESFSVKPLLKLLLFRVCTHKRYWIAALLILSLIDY